MPHTWDTNKINNLRTRNPSNFLWELITWTSPLAFAERDNEEINKCQPLLSSYKGFSGFMEVHFDHYLMKVMQLSKILSLLQGINPGNPLWTKHNGKIFPLSWNLGWLFTPVSFMFLSGFSCPLIARLAQHAALFALLFPQCQCEVHTSF